MDVLITTVFTVTTFDDAGARRDPEYAELDPAAAAAATVPSSHGKLAVLPRVWSTSDTHMLFARLPS
jgi:hypothetical protein